MSARDGMERRGFLARAIAGLTALGVMPEVSHASSPAVQGGWDMSWLDKLTGKHKQVFDFQDPTALRVIRNWLDAHEEVYGLKPPQVNAVIGITRPAFTVNASDALYQKFPLGELWKVNDPDTGKPALRNIYLSGGKTPKEQAATVQALQARGVIFWQCNNSLHGTATTIGEAVKRPEPEVYQELRAGLNPGVIVVPAHAMLLGLCQERGCSYEAI